ncbi:BTB/POZ domain-containing protein KCTD6-like [Anneissia japonica]|uniref:BTB/POZ domain-containing protein KCTD6-like n=1 Tax=Anneissia japonica TaxID=1529436 RepID=UPI001425B428|nr:BTB/POZ domain-containing protein KCTD6-like [Anneissia japonica]
MADEIINLNVGGCIYATSRSTLTRYPDSMLGSMFSGRLPTKVDHRNRYIIDGDGPTFRHILNFLRRSMLILPHGFQEWSILSAEAHYYQLKELIILVNTEWPTQDENASTQSTASDSYEFRREFLELEWCKHTFGFRISAKISVFSLLQLSTGYFRYSEENDTYTPADWLYDDPDIVSEVSLDASTYYVFSLSSVDRLSLFEKISERGFTLFSSSSGIDENYTTFHRCLVNYCTLPSNTGFNIMALPAAEVADEVLNLNVGGCIYTTSRSTLARYPDSMLGSMFNGSLPSAVDDCHRYIIDGDGPTFRHILNFLRRSNLILPDGFQELDILSAEADYYQIQELIQLVNTHGGFMANQK